MTERIRILLSPSIAATAVEANALGVAPGHLIEADLTRLRHLAEAAAADLALSPVEASAVGWVLQGLEQSRLVTLDDSLPSGSTLAASLIEIADDRTDAEILILDRLARRAATWPPLAILGLMIRARQAE
ncbi:hypothetical protein [Prosthecomicrobium hirschii]|uniref:Uncharacterized protein n=1 Tax=Prosthecodimorpha hirschii TaxID=665126 RepID=A0A0P6VYR0_9HYPH|nr:hypothetical protein [Prosthecomicrobium hirschii]KPL50820.1 hypothetical protein ABB55_00050 [Prosthecomicrobium hirschii]MCW1839423.1 hypothetical protein [Prosthecomicrobium hirschii]